MPIQIEPNHLLSVDEIRCLEPNGEPKMFGECRLVGHEGYVEEVGDIYEISPGSNDIDFERIGDEVVFSFDEPRICEAEAGYLQCEEYD